MGPVCLELWKVGRRLFHRIRCCVRTRKNTWDYYCKYLPTNEKVILSGSRSLTDDQEGNNRPGNSTSLGEGGSRLVNSGLYSNETPSLNEVQLAFCPGLKQGSICKLPLPILNPCKSQEEEPTGETVSEHHIHLTPPVWSRRCLWMMEIFTRVLGTL